MVEKINISSDDKFYIKDLHIGDCFVYYSTKKEYKQKIICTNKKLSHNSHFCIKRKLIKMNLLKLTFLEKNCTSNLCIFNIYNML